MVSQKHVHVHVVHNDSTGTTVDFAGTSSKNRWCPRNYSRYISLLQKVLHDVLTGFFDAR